MIAINTRTAMDYLGESGIGAWSYGEPKHAAQLNQAAFESSGKRQAWHRTRVSCELATGRTGDYWPKWIAAAKFAQRPSCKLVRLLGPIARNLLQSDFRLGVTVPICRGLLMVDEHIICWNSWRAAASEQTLTECGNAPEGI